MATQAGADGAQQMQPHPQQQSQQQQQRGAMLSHLQQMPRGGMGSFGLPWRCNAPRCRPAAAPGHARPRMAGAAHASTRRRRWRRSGLRWLRGEHSEASSEQQAAGGGAAGGGGAGGAGNAAALGAAAGFSMRGPPAAPEPSRLHYEVLGFQQAIYAEMEPIERDVHVILHSLREIVNARWQGASAELYGSRSTGLALSSSDMDVVLLDISCPPSGVGPALRRLSDDLQECGWVKKQTLVLSARIPVLKLQSTSGVPVDITIAATNHHTGLAARDLVLKMTQVAPPIVPLVLVLKTFLRALSLNDPYTGGISSYCIVVLLHKYYTETQGAFYYNKRSGIDSAFFFELQDCGLLLLHFLHAFVHRFEKQLTHVDDPLTPPVFAEDGTLLQPSENIMQSCYQISRLCQCFRRAAAAISPDNPEVGPWAEYDGSLLDRLLAVAGHTRATQEIAAKGKRAAGGMHKFDPDEVDVHGGNATADDFMDAFGFWIWKE